MSPAIQIEQCPVCGSADFQTVLKAKDFTVSGEEFPIAECRQCSLRFTESVPDQHSIGKYYQSEDYISHSNTSKGIVNRLYQLVRKKTLVRKRKLVQRETGLKTGMLLDIGSGIGAFASEMKANHWEVTALEPDPGARKVGFELYGLEMGVMEDLASMTEERFDAITLWHVLEHVHDLHGYIKIFRNVLTPQGRLLIAVPNYTSLDAGMFGEFWAAYDVPRHLYHFSPESMKVLMQQHGLTVESMLPMWYDSFYISLLSSKYKTGNSALVSSFVNGLRSNYAAWKNVARCSSVIYVIRKQDK